MPSHPVHPAYPLQPQLLEPPPLLANSPAQAFHLQMQPQALCQPRKLSCYVKMALGIVSRQKHQFRHSASSRPRSRLASRQQPANRERYYSSRRRLLLHPNPSRRLERVGGLQLPLVIWVGLYLDPAQHSSFPARCQQRQKHLKGVPHS